MRVTRAMGSSVSAPASRASWTWRAESASQLSSSQRSWRRRDRRARTSGSPPRWGGARCKRRSAPASAPVPLPRGPRWSAAPGHPAGDRPRAGAAGDGGAASAASRNLQHSAAAGQTAGESRRCERVQVGVAREPQVERLEPLGSLEQQRRSVAAAAHREGDLAAQQIDPSTPQLVERARLGGGQQVQRGVGRARLGAWPAPRPTRAAPAAPARASASPRARGTRRRRQAPRAPALARPSAPAPRRPPRPAPPPRGRDATRGDQDRRLDRSPRRARDAPPAARPRRPPGRPPSAPADDGNAPAHRAR